MAASGRSINRALGMTPPVARTLALARIGGPEILSRRLADIDITIAPHTIRKWVVIPAVHVMAVARLAGLHPYDLRPDLAPPKRRAA